MDSVSQFVLGASIGLAVSPYKTPKVAIVCGLLASIPDLDILLDYGDDLSNMVNHRSFSHSFFVLSLVAIPIAKLMQKIFASYLISYKRCLAISLLVLVTHPMLDSLTIFGTQVFWPLELDSVMIGSMFIIDFFYTLPLLASLGILLIKKRLPVIYGISTNTWALSLSTAYLLLSLLLQSYVLNISKPPTNNIINRLAMPTPFNLIIWRSVVIDDEYIYENFHHLFKGAGIWLKTPHNKQKFVVDNTTTINEYKHFTHKFYRFDDKNGKLIISDVRMGTVNMPVMSFVIANKQEDGDYKATIPKSTTLNRFIFRKMFGGQSLF